MCAVGIISLPRAWHKEILSHVKVNSYYGDVTGICTSQGLWKSKLISVTSYLKQMFIMNKVGQDLIVKPFVGKFHAMSSISLFTFVNFFI